MNRYYIINFKNYQRFFDNFHFDYIKKIQVYKTS